MKISVITNGISQDYETCCKVMNETGVRYGELQEAFGKRVELFSMDEAKQIRALNEKYGISTPIVSTHAFVGIPVGGIEVGDAAYQKQMELLKTGIAVARIVGTKMVRAMSFAKQTVIWGYHGCDQWNANNNVTWGKLLELYKPIAKLVEDEGIDLVIETGFNAMVTSGYLGRRFVTDLGSRNVSILWDPANSLYVGDVSYPDAYDRLKGIARHVHIKDVIVNPVESLADVTPIGRGMLAPYLLRIADALRRDDYQGYVSLENIYRPDGGDYIDGYRIDIETMKEIFS